MSRESILNAQGAFEILDTYQSQRIKEAVTTLREAFEPIITKNVKEISMEKYNLKYSYKNFFPEKRVSQVIDTLSSAITIYEEAADNEAKANKTTQDILHAIELLDLSEDEMVTMARELHEIRKIRREAKDFTEIMLPLYDLACKYQHITKELTQVKSEMQKIANQKENRTYKVRERTDLAEKFEKMA